MPIRSRDLRDNIRMHGYERGVVMSMEAFLEEYAETRQHMRDIVQLVDMCIDQMRRFNAIGEGMTKQIDQIKRDRAKGEEI